MQGVRLECNYLEAPDVELEVRFKWEHLHRRRQTSHLLFLYKLVSGMLNCFDLLHLIKLLDTKRNKIHGHV